jgi:hypothetical protein
VFSPSRKPLLARVRATLLAASPDPAPARTPADAEPSATPGTERDPREPLCPACGFGPMRLIEKLPAGGLRREDDASRAPRPRRLNSPAAARGSAAQGSLVSRPRDPVPDGSQNPLSGLPEVAAAPSKPLAAPSNLPPASSSPRLKPQALRARPGLSSTTLFTAASRGKKP